VHTGNAARDLYDELGIETCFSPTYSPELNSIEYWFSWMKREVKQQRLKDMVRGNSRTYREIIPTVVRKIDPKTIDNCVKHVMNLYKIIYK